MYCPKCGAENPDDAQLCRSCSSVLTITPTQPPSLGVKTSGLAIAALILGILSFFTCGIAALPAIILGIISLVRIEKSGGRITGRGFAIGGIVVPVVALPILFSMMILMPALNRAKKQARSVLCMSNLKQWGTIFAMYTDDNNGFFPRRTSSSGRWINVIYDYYYRDEKIRVCPTATKIKHPVYPHRRSSALEVGGDKFTSWGKVDLNGSRLAGKYEPAGMWGSYGINHWLYVAAQDPLYGQAAKDYWGTVNVKGSGNIPMFLDCWFWCAGPEHDDTPPSFDGERFSPHIDSMNRFCINRHEGCINGAFLDYSVRRVGLKELWTLRWHRNYNTNGPWTRSGGVQPTDWPQWMRNFRDY